MSDRSAAITAAPPRPEKPASRIDRTDDRLSIEMHQRGGAGCFLALWLIAWTVGCVFLAGQVIADPALGMIAFAVPFWAAWLFVASLVIWSFAGRERLSLAGDELEFVKTAIITLSRRVVPLSEVHGFRGCRSLVQENDRYLYGIEVETSGKPIKFGFRLPERERLWLISQLNDILRQLRPAGANPVVELPGSEFESESHLPASHAAVAGLTLHEGNTLESPPSDNSWMPVEDFDALAYRQRGRLQVGALCGLLFVNAFWNGIVSVFVLAQFGLMPGNNQAPQGFGRWGLFVFLIPFEVIGLVMFAGLVVTLLEPFRRTWLKFERDRLVVETVWPFYRRRREWTMGELDRLELRRADSTETKSFSDVKDFGNDREYRLAFVTVDNADLCGIDDLTSGEARWIARGVLDRRSEWFPSRS